MIAPINLFYIRVTSGAGFDVVRFLPFEEGKKFGRDPLCVVGAGDRGVGEYFACCANLVEASFASDESYIWLWSVDPVTVGCWAVVDVLSVSLDVGCESNVE